jgi:hypothetical protein
VRGSRLADEERMLFARSGVIAEFTAYMRATTPATCGEAIEVPCREQTPPDIPGQREVLVERIEVPGAERVTVVP